MALLKKRRASRGSTSRRRTSSVKTKKKTKTPKRTRRASSAKKTKTPHAKGKGKKKSSTTTKKNSKKTKTRSKKTKTPKHKTPRRRRASSAKRARGSKRKRRQSNVRKSRSTKRRKVVKKVTNTPKPTGKKRRKRRQSRTGADTRRLKPRKNRVKTSGPVEINAYTYDVLYKQFLDEFLPKLSKENGVKVDKRSCRVMRNIFDPPTLAEEQYEELPSPSMLKKAQEAVFAEIARQEKQSKRGKTTGRRSGMERMFYLATGEEELFVDFDMMRKLVKETKLYKFTGDDRHDMGYMDPNINRIKINSGHRMTIYDITVTLMHECMHNTIKRVGRPGNPEISEATEHLAMALCGDPDEFTVLLAEPKLDDFESYDDEDSFGEEYTNDCDYPWEETESDNEYEKLMSDEKYYQKYLMHIQKLGFELDDIPDICSPDCKKDLQRAEKVGMENLQRDPKSPARCRLTLHSTETTPKLVRCRTI